jgi:hypothetical protein
VVVLVLVAVRFVPVLQNWISMHDQNPGSGQFLHRNKPNGMKQFVYLSAFAESLSLPVALAAVVGIYLLWRRDRTLAVYLTSVALFPILFLTLISARTPVSQFYLVPSLPVFFIGAGVFLDRLFQIDWKLEPQWLLPAVITIMALTAGAPTLISQYLNGRRFDFRGVAQWLQPRMATGDPVFSDQPMVLAHYLPKAKIDKLRKAPALDQAFGALQQTGRSGALWIVAPQPAHTFRFDLKEGGLAGWIYEHCELRNTVGVGRVDFRQQYLQVYRCPARAPEG